MPAIGVIASDAQEAKAYLEALIPWGAEPILLLPGFDCNVQDILARITGLLLAGGTDINPTSYGAELSLGTGPIKAERDAFELPLLRGALDLDLPILGICRGMQAINVAMGGCLIQDIPDHKEIGEESTYHRIFISPGSKLAASLGSGGQVRVNSRHHQGVREPQKAPTLLASAYNLEDGIIEALESPHHSWALGIQCRPERSNEVPRQFQRLFQALVEQARRRD
jgi:putative glutamine amidotransferase